MGKRAEKPIPLLHLKALAYGKVNRQPADKTKRLANNFFERQQLCGREILGNVYDQYDRPV